MDPHLVIQKEGKYDVPVYYRMNFDGQTPKQNHFSVDSHPGRRWACYFYYFDLYTDFRRIVRGPDNCGVVSWQEGESWQLTVYDARTSRRPDSIKGKVFYQIFPDRFCEGVENKPMPFPDRHLSGRQARRAVLAAQRDRRPPERGLLRRRPERHPAASCPTCTSWGWTCLYLNPIFEAHSNHRYNTADYLNVDPLLGTNEDFAALCAEAKEYGIRHRAGRRVQPHRLGQPSISTGRAATARAAPTTTRTAPTAAGTTLTPSTRAATAAGGALTPCPKSTRRRPSYRRVYLRARAASSTPGCAWGAAGFRLDVADELPDSFH